MRNNSKIFRSSSWVFLLKFSAFFALLIISTIAYGMYPGARYLARMEASFFSLFPFVAGGTLALGLITTVYHSVFAIVRHFGTFIKVTPEYIEYQNWPYFGIICRWQEISSLEKRKKYGFNFGLKYF